MPIDLNTGIVSFSALVSFFLLFSLITKDDEFIKKNLSPFYLDFTILASALLLAGLFFIVRPEISTLKIDLLSGLQVFVVICFVVFVYLRITLRKRLEDRGFVITLMKEEDYEKLTGHLDGLKEIEI